MTTYFSPLKMVLALALCSVPSTAAAQDDPICGDVDASGSIAATDALIVLGTAVGQPTIPPLLCPYCACGDGNVEGEESCDQGDLGGTTCVDLGLFGDGLTCGSGCQFDPTGCIQSRYTNNGDGTLTDNKTRLQWELKTDDDSVHDKDNTYTWSDTGTDPDGRAFAAFLGALNNCVEEPGFPPTGVTGGFAGHCDWRLPTIVELQTIVDANATGCSSGTACIDPIYGPTINYNYWSSITFAENTGFAWFADFDVGQVEEGAKSGAFSVRAVRSGLE